MLTTQIPFEHMRTTLKKNRNFNPSQYINLKCKAINEFFAKNNLNAAVIGISGGIDSAVAYKLLVEASKQENSPIKKIHATLMPIRCKGTTDQNEATKRGLEVVETSDVCFYYVDDLTDACNAYIKSMTNNIDHFEAYPKPNNWSIGQLASIVRTPNLYFRAAYLQQHGYKSIVIGTTNRDEGSYIGFFGKASDAMVDLQPIADIHKSEVIEVAKRLNVPQSIIDATPKGDVWDGRCDEEMIGAPYWFLEMYIQLKEEHGTSIINQMYNETFTHDQREVFKKYATAIEEIHKTNAHKYEVGSPSHFIDVMPRKVTGGWK